MTLRDELIQLIARKQFTHITDAKVQKFADDILDIIAEHI